MPWWRVCGQLLIQVGVVLVKWGSSIYGTGPQKNTILIIINYYFGTG